MWHRLGMNRFQRRIPMRPPRPPRSDLPVSPSLAPLALSALGMFAAALCLAAAWFAANRSAADAAPPPQEPPVRVLLVTATAGFRHSSIETARDVVARLGADSGALHVTLLAEVDDVARLNAETLAGHDVVFFANTSGELPLDDAQKQALLAFVAAGGGFVGTHSATDTLYSWPEYGRLVGAFFQEHPWTQPARAVPETPTHPLVAAFEPSLELLEEFYVFRTNPRANESTLVLLRLDPASVGAAGDIPLAWCATYGAGRTYYNALGHFESTWEDPRFQQHLLDALRWAAGRGSAACA
jgi:type 1 glutamine amidotransferase